MTVPFAPVTIAALRAEEAFVHGFSPRHIEWENGQSRDLDFGRNAGREAWRGDLVAYLGALGIAGDSVFGVHQVHGDRVHVVSRPSFSLPGKGPVQADAIVTHLADFPIAVLTADCIPVVLYDPHRHVTGVVHAGRLGTALHIVSRAVAALKENYGSRPEDLIAGLGPGICGACYEVDEVSIDPFRHGFSGWENWTVPQADGKFLLDLLAANREDLTGAGVPLAQIHQTSFCTSCNNDGFFSYRKEGARGRMMTLAMLTPR